MRTPLITRREHERLMSEHGEQCRETLIIRHRLWDKTQRMAEEQIKELEHALLRNDSVPDHASTDKP